MQNLCIKSEFEIFTNTTFNLKQILSKSFLYNYYIKTVNDTSSTITDLLIEENTYTEFFNTKLNSKYLKHGSGCVLSASITANLMNGHDLKTAIKFAKEKDIDSLRPRAFHKRCRNSNKTSGFWPPAERWLDISTVWRCSKACKL